MAQHLKNWAGPGSSGHYWSITTTYRALQKLSEENSKATSAAKLTAWHNRALLAQLPPKSFLGRAASCLHGKSIGSSAAERRRKSSSRASQNGSCVGDNQLTVVADNFSGDGGDAGDDLAGVTILFGPRGASESAVKAFSQQILSASAAFLLLLCCCFYAFAAAAAAATSSVYFSTALQCLWQHRAVRTYVLSKICRKSWKKCCLIVFLRQIRKSVLILRVSNDLGHGVISFTLFHSDNWKWTILRQVANIVWKRKDWKL